MRYSIICSLLFLAGCISRSDKKAILLKQDKEIVFANNAMQGEYSHLSIATNRSGESFVFLFDKADTAALFFDVNGNQTKRIRLHFADSLRKYVPQLFLRALNEDTLLAIFAERPELFFINSSGEIVNTTRLTAELNDGSNHYLLPGVSQSPPLLYQSNLVLTSARVDIVVRDEAARKKYFSTPPYIVIDLSSLQQSNCGHWPANYRNGESFRDFYPQHCINDKGQVVMGFAASDSLFVMENGRLISSYSCKSRYMTQRHPYPDDSLGHFSYLEQYDVVEPRYRFLIYDPSRKYYYRIVHHTLPYEQPGGMTVNDYLDKPWSLMILNENFEILDEVIFDPKKFKPRVFPVKDGLLILNREENSSNLPVKFTLFRIQ